MGGPVSQGLPEGSVSWGLSGPLGASWAVLTEPRGRKRSCPSGRALVVIDLVGAHSASQWKSNQMTRREIYWSLPLSKTKSKLCVRVVRHTSRPGLRHTRSFPDGVPSTMWLYL